MGSFRELYRAINSNDIKSINASIENIGHKHHAIYITNMMFINDIVTNNYLLSKIPCVINSLYEVIRDNCQIRNQSCNMLRVKTRGKMLLNPYGNRTLTGDRLRQLVHRQALKFYFDIDEENAGDYADCFYAAIQYRISSNFLQNEIRHILVKVYEDIQIIKVDTYNIEFLLQCCKKASGKGTDNENKLKLFIECIENDVFQNDRFNEQYFEVVKRIDRLLQNM